MVLKFPKLFRCRVVFSIFQHTQKCYISILKIGVQSLLGSILAKGNDQDSRFTSSRSTQPEVKYNKTHVYKIFHIEK